jgi:hypothetical protein
MVKTLADKATQEKFAKTGGEPVPPDLQTSKGFGDYIKKEYANSKEAAQLAGLKPE